MTRRSRLPRAELQIEHWPQVDARALDRASRQTFMLRRASVLAYAKGARSIEVVQSGLDRKTLMRMIRRALQPHDDGRLWGWRALVPHTRVKTFERTLAPKVLVHTKAGNAGVFAQLLSRFPVLEASLRAELRPGAVELIPSGTGVRLAGVKAAAERFRAKCRALGLTPRDYPLNQVDRAVRSLARTLRGWLDDDPQRAAAAASARVKPASALRRLPERAALRAFDTVEFDAHKLDLRLKVVDIDPTGGEQVLEIERVWLLAVIDVATRCILGWTISLARECNRTHVLQTIGHAVIPQSPPEITLPGLRLFPEGGFVSHSIEAARYACWRQIRLDNARAHLATSSLDVLCETLGCTADFGPAYEPDDRPFIERYFGTVVRTLSRRLPGSLRASRHPQAALARLRSPTDSLRMLVTADELEEILAVAIWNYHGTPHSALGGATPLEVMRRHLHAMVDAEDGDLCALRRLPELLRTHPALLQDPLQCLVRGNPARGERPYVTYMHVRYSSAQLAKSGRLHGKKLRVYSDPSDLRTLLAVTPEGEVLEPLLASSIWRHERHSLWLRREFFKARRMRMLDVDADDNPIEAFVQQRRQAARKKSGKKASKRAASDLARAQRDRRADPSADASHGAAPTGRPAVLDQLASGPVQATRLRIEPSL